MSKTCTSGDEEEAQKAPSQTALVPDAALPPLPAEEMYTTPSNATAAAAIEIGPESAKGGSLE